MLTIYSFVLVDACTFKVDVLYQNKRFTDVLTRPSPTDLPAEWKKLTGLQQDFFLLSGVPKKGDSYTLPAMFLPKILQDRLTAAIKRLA